VGVAACGDSPHTPANISAPPSRPVAAGVVELAEVSLPFVTVEAYGEASAPALVRAPGRIALRDGAVAEVGAPVAGRVVAVHVRTGDAVEAGAPLFTLASAAAAALRGDLARQRVVRDAARAAEARQLAMIEQGVGVPATLAEVRAALAAAEAELAALEASAAAIGPGRRAETVVRAPVAGTVLARDVTVGRTVDAGGEPLVTLGAADAIWVVASVFERELPLVRVGMTAEVRLASVAEPLPAQVERVAARVDPETRRADVYLALREPPPAGERAPRAGMFARTTIDLGAASASVPSSSVLVKEGGRTVVYAEIGPRRFARTDVEVGHPVDGRVPILAGLERGAKVVTRGALLLDGNAEMVR